jgi:hypothetical protein
VATLLFVKAVGESGGCRLVDEAQDFETGDFAGVFCRLALRIVEISGNGDNSAIDGLAEMSFGPVFQFAEDERRNFGRRECLVAEFDANDVLAGWVDAEREEF